MTDEMLVAAMKEAVKQGLVPKYAADEQAYLQYWQAIEAVVRETLEAAIQRLEIDAATGIT
ncbi:hypothetical protein [Variovorax sp. M-6]|uniref:hypothetical protein n=1 Tax=Variovorax sp. M-6 TaxID=3233041 RepID=UPI003F95A578